MNQTVSNLTEVQDAQLSKSTRWPVNPCVASQSRLSQRNAFNCGLWLAADAPLRNARHLPKLAPKAPPPPLM